MQRCGEEGFSAKGKGLGRSRGRRPGGGAADAGFARISRPEGGLACGPTLPPLKPAFAIVLWAWYNRSS